LYKDDVSIIGRWCNKILKILQEFDGTKTDS